MAKKKYHGGEGWGMDRSSYANLPQEVVMKQYPKTNGYGLTADYVDTAGGIDDMNAATMNRVKKQLRTPRDA